jgi:single-stranded DNA-binding protein
MASYNKCILVGNLTRDPEIRYVDAGGKAVTKFSLAVNRRTKQGDEAMFIDIIAWDKLGETCNTYLKKGAAALVEGRLTIRTTRPRTASSAEPSRSSPATCSSLAARTAVPRPRRRQPPTTSPRTRCPTDGRP